MLAYTYIDKADFQFIDKPKPTLLNDTDAVVRVTLASICSSDLHIKHGFVPRAVRGITVGHEMVGVVEEVGSAVTSVEVGDRVTVNVETFCGECFFCKKGFVNNCTDPNGGWALGCRIDGGQTEYVRVPLAQQGLNKIPDSVSDEQALLVGDVLATGFWAARISEITEVLTVSPENVVEFVKENSDHSGTDVVLEVAGSEDTFRLAWECARPNAIVTVVALYSKPQILPLPDMYGKNLIFKTGGVDGCDCEEILRLIENGEIDTTPLITHTYPLADIEAAYELFEKRMDGVIKVAVIP